MNRRFLAAWALLFVVWMAGSFVIHGLLLVNDYKALPNLYRSEEDSQKYFPLMLLSHVILAGALAWIYPRGHDAARPWAGQGVRFGIAIAFLTVIPTYTIYFVVQPMPGSLAVRQILFDGLLLPVLGLLVAYLHRSKAAKARA